MFGVLFRSLLVRSALVLVVVAVLVWGLAMQSGDLMNWLITKEDQLRSWRDDLPIRTFVVALGLYFVACFIPGTYGKSFICGWLFGVLRGTILVNSASILAAFTMFFVARFLLRARIESRYAGYLIGIQNQIQQNGGVYLFAIRAVPVVPFALVNVLMGVTEIRSRTFWWASQLGMLPGNIALVLAGASLPHLYDLQEKNWTEILNVQLVGSLILIITLPFVVRSLLIGQRHFL